MNTEKAHIHEIYSAIQGEGPLVGIRQILVRLCECNVRCHFCDTPASRMKSEICRVEKIAGERNFILVPNPSTVEQVVESVKLLNRTRHHSLALTGGEPLVQEAFLLEVLPSLRSMLPIYLETNGTLPEVLEKVLSQIDYIAMDIKLPSATEAADYFQAHERFLAIAKAGKKEVFVKIVLTADLAEEELDQAFALVAKIDPSIEVILQPVTGETPAPSPVQVLRWQELGLEHLASVRVIPQTHKLMGQL